MPKTEEAVRHVNTRGTDGGRDRARRIRRAAAGEPQEPRRALVAATLAAKRAEHPELAGVPTLEQLLAIADREMIYLHDAPNTVRWLARTSGFPGCLGISVRRGLSDRVRRVVVAHELAHCWLHFSDDALLEDVVHSGISPDLRQRCEDEADLLAAELLQQPFEIVEAVTRTTREGVLRECA